MADEQSVPRPVAQKSIHDIYSSLVKVPRVELFDWRHPVEVHPAGKAPETRFEQIKDIQAIYINPRWRQSNVGDRMLFDDKRQVTYKSHLRYARRKGGEVYREDSDSSDDAARKQEEQR